MVSLAAAEERLLQSVSALLQVISQVPEQTL
jgi:hypothetical protein